MRLSNRNKTPLYSFIYSLAGIIFILGVIAFILEANNYDIFGKMAWVLIVGPLMLFAFLYLLGKPIFEYDSDGEALNFRNNHILYVFSRKNAKDEFPKYKLLKYNVVSILFFKKLYIYVSSKKNHTVILKYDISYLAKKEIKDLKFSLNKVVKANQELRSEDNLLID